MAATLLPVTAAPSPASAQDAYPEVVLAAAPIAYWRLDETSGSVASDASGSDITADYQGAPELGVPGLVVGSSAATRFSGQPEALAVPDSSLINAGSPYRRKSVELWFRADDVGPRQMLFEQGGISRGLSVYLANGMLYLGAWNVATDDATTPWGPLFVSAPVAAEETYHAVLVFDYGRGSVEAYLDGVTIGTVAGAGRLFPHGNDAGIGATRDHTVFHDGVRIGEGDHFGGVIDEIALYNDALNAETVAIHHLLGSTPAAIDYAATVLADSPVAYWRVAETTGPGALDSSGNGLTGLYEGDPQLGAGTLISGGSGAAVTLDGLNDSVTIPDSPLINVGGPYNARTIEAWFVAPNTTNTQVIFEEGALARGLVIYVAQGAVWLGGWNLADAAPWGPIFMSRPVTAGETHHVVLVLDGDGGTLEGYVDGMGAGTFSPAGDLGLHGGDMAIGAMNEHTRTHAGSNLGNGLHFGGTIDEVALYNTALSGSQVAAHYDVGTANEPPTVTTTAPASGAFLDGDVTVVVVASDAEDPPGSLSVEVSVDGGGSWQPAQSSGIGNVYERLWSTGNYENGMYAIRTRATDSGGVVTAAAPVFVDVDNSPAQPLASIVSPGQGDAIGGTVSITVQAEDPADPEGTLVVEISADGADWLVAPYAGANDLYTLDWNSLTADGLTLIQARATNSAAQTVLAPPISVMVVNPSYPDLVLADGPGVYYRVGETSGTVAFDASGHGTPAVYGGSPTLGVPGLLTESPDRAVALDGVNDLVVLPNSGHVNLGTRSAHSIELWFSSLDVANRQVLYEQGGLGRGASIYIEEGLVYLGMWNIDNQDPAKSWGPYFLSAPIAPNTTYHTVLVLDQPQDRLEAYLDGLSIGSHAGVGLLSSHTNDGAIGAMKEHSRTEAGGQVTDGLNFSGAIDEVAVYPIALSETSITSHFVRGSGFAGNRRPQATVVGPADGSIIAGSATVIEVVATDVEDRPEDLIVHVSVAGSELRTANYNVATQRHQLTWNTTSEQDGVVTIDAIVSDSGLLTAAAAQISVLVNNVDDGPVAAIENPATGGTAHGLVEIRVDAADLETSDGGLSVQVSIGGGPWTTAGPSAGTTYALDWDTTALADGQTSIAARALDGAGQQATAATTFRDDRQHDHPADHRRQWGHRIRKQPE